MINNTGTLQFLYWNVHMPIIVAVIQLVIGIMIGLFAYKLSRNLMGYILGIYMGCILGGMAGCIIYENLISICVGAVIGGLIFGLINELVDNGYIFIVSFTVFMQITYMLIISFVNLFGINGYEILGKYPDLLEDYVSKDATLVIALIIGGIVGMVMLKKDFVNKHYLTFTSFVGVIQLTGAMASCEAPFYMGGEWEDFFLPFLSVEYSEHTWWFLAVIVLAGTALAFAQNNKAERVIKN